MSAILTAVLPVFLLIFLGTAFRRTGFLGAAFWEAAERLTYFALLPALLVRTLADADFAGLAALAMAGAIMLAILVMATGLLLVRPLLSLDGPAFTSLFQGTQRTNTYIGLAVAAGLFGPPGLAAAAIAVAATVPLVNILSVAALARFAATTAPSVRGTVWAFVRNPLLLACLLGLLLNASGLGLPQLIEPLLTIMGRGALPLGLLAVGAGLNFATVRGSGRLLAASCGLKLLVMPGLTAFACWALGANGLTAAVAVMFNALPTATSTYILARQMGGDAPAMAAMITLQTAVALVALPVVLVLIGA
ncbi:MAG: AEC family transporter [Kiloniellales bacterium]|nr:AEC family transporter [Kiloniellales bacterium]